MTRKPTAIRKPGFYWVQVIRFGVKTYQRAVPGEFFWHVDRWQWRVLGWGEARFTDDDLSVGDRIPPPTKRRANAKR